MLNIVLSGWLRCLLALGFIGGLGVAAADAQQGPRQHALSLLGTPKFGPDFKNFDWVNPNAPKGGSVRQWAFGSFDSLNPYPVKGSPATSLGLIHTTLMTSSPDEPSTEYGVLAEWVSHPDDYSSVTYGLRAGAKFHQSRTFGDDRADLGGPFAQDPELGARRIVFRQHRDLLEQCRARGVIEIFWR